MSEFNNSHWTKEEKAAFEIWLKISIEMIEKYCTDERFQEVELLELSDYEAEDI